MCNIYTLIMQKEIKLSQLFLSPPKNPLCLSNHEVNVKGHWHQEQIMIIKKQTSIRYAKENDREKRERRREKGRRRDIEREGEIRERERKRDVRDI